MHVCHFCETSVEGAYLRHLSRGLSERGVKVTLVELGAYKPPAWLNEVPEVEYFNLNIGRRIEYPLAAWKLSRLLRAQRVDILQTHLYYGGIIGVLTKFIGGAKKVVLTRHHSSVVHMLGKWPHIAADKWMAEKADYVVTVSEAAKRFMIEQDHIKRSDIEVVHLGFDFDEFKPTPEARTRIRHEFGFGDRDCVIGYVANFPEGKGHLQLLEAFSLVVAKIPNARLFLVGQGDRTRIDHAIARLGIADSVIFSGWRNDNAACMNAMDIFVQPSLSEAFSQVLVEAMGVGLPVIATSVGEATEVISDGRSGILVAPNDSESLFNAIMRLQQDPDLRTAIAEAGRRSVREKFTISNMVDRQFHLYERWLGEKKPDGTDTL